MEPEETECVLPADTVSLLVQENLQKEGAADWVTDWFSDCRLEVGTTIRIPYDPDEIATLSETFESTQPVEVVEDIPVVSALSTPSAMGVDEDNDDGYDLLVAEDTAMPEETDNDLVAQTVDPTGGLVGEFGNLAQSTQDPTLTLLLAILERKVKKLEKWRKSLEEDDE